MLLGSDAWVLPENPVSTGSSLALEEAGAETASTKTASTDAASTVAMIEDLTQTLFVTEAGELVRATRWGVGGQRPANAQRLVAMVPGLAPSHLGAASFQRDHNVRVNYVAGAMANGIASVELVQAMARAGMLAFFGAAGLSTAKVADAIDTLQRTLAGLPYGVNLIHSPAEPWQEQQTVDLLIDRGVRTISASAYMKLTPMLVQYRLTGVRRVDGEVQAPNKIFAKVSRPEVAAHFLRPAPKAMVDKLLAEGRITADEAMLAPLVRMADDLTAEADSGGHTDNRPLPVLLPVLRTLAAEMAPAGTAPARVGAAGGLGDPSSVATAFAMGADYVLTGTVNQACVEAGTSDMVRDLLADAQMADIGLAPASDMFEGGVTVQVLTRGTMFAARGRSLYQIYRDYDSVDALPADVRTRLERTVFARPMDEVWAECEAYFAQVDPEQIERAANEPKHKLALICRWYLGKSSHWAIGGVDTRRMDAQIWCGPAIGSFNQWTAGTPLAAPAARSVAVVAANFMAGACAHLRAQQLRLQGFDPGPYFWRPRAVRMVPTGAGPALGPSVSGVEHARA